MIYIAGLFDGEGSVTIAKMNPSQKSRMKNCCHYLTTIITNNNKPVLDWAKDTFGGNIYCKTPKEQKETVRNLGWRWYLNSNQARFFLQRIYYYLKIKKQEAMLGINFQAEKAGFVDKKKGISPRNMARRIWYKERLNWLNANDDCRSN